MRSGHRTLDPAQRWVRWPATVGGLISAVVVLILAGCGVPMQSEPVPIDPGAVPTRLQASPGTASGRLTTTPGQPALRLTFVRDDKLVSVVREAPATTTEDRLTTVIDALTAGPITPEQASGITTALSPELTLTVAEIQGTHVVLVLSGETDGRSATENVLAVGQIVLSLTALPTVEQVSFSRDGEPVEALLADGALTTAPLTATDYETLRGS